VKRTLKRTRALFLRSKSNTSTAFLHPSRSVRTNHHGIHVLPGLRGSGRDTSRRAKGGVGPAIWQQRFFGGAMRRCPPPQAAAASPTGAWFLLYLHSPTPPRLTAASLPVWPPTKHPLKGPRLRAWSESSIKVWLFCRRALRSPSAPAPLPSGHFVPLHGFCPKLAGAVAHSCPSRRPPLHRRATDPSPALAWKMSRPRATVW